MEDINAILERRGTDIQKRSEELADAAKKFLEERMREKRERRWKTAGWVTFLGVLALTVWAVQNGKMRKV